MRVLFVWFNFEYELTLCWASNRTWRPAQAAFGGSRAGRGAVSTGSVHVHRPVPEAGCYGRQPRRRSADLTAQFGSPDIYGNTLEQAGALVCLPYRAVFPRGGPFAETPNL